MIAEVIIEISHQNIDKVFHYIVPKNLESKVKIGLRVKVPFGKGNKKIRGYIVGFSNNSSIEYEKLKSINNIEDLYPVFDEHMLELAKWMKDYYGARMIDCLKCMMPPFMKITSEKYISINRQIPLEKLKNIIKEYKNKKKYKAQARILSFLMDNNEIPLSEIKKILQISNSSIKSLINKNLIQIKEVDLDKDPYSHIDFKKTKPLIPTHEQKNVIEYIINKLNNAKGEEILLHGITGSGKTEIYLQIIDEVIKLGGQAIVLVPEISLTPQTVERFKNRFGEKVAFTHSKLSYGERFVQWKKAKEGKISVMIGPRSAVFTPFPSLKLIILDEEHETTYKSEISPKYHAKEVAKKRCDMVGGLCLRSSATPSLDSYYEAKQGQISLLTINNRVNNSALPKVDIIDMRKELEAGNRSIFSIKLKEEIQKNLDKKEQVILFLNRRGFSNFVSCRKCGYVLKCKNCNISYTYHAYNNSLQCHYCGDKATVPSVCPQCGSSHIKYFGVGTEKVEEKVKEEFPEARVLRMDLDTAKGKYGHEKILNKFKSMEADILIGTQMIAKGHDFPNVTLVGILAADLTLHIQDFRSAEKTFQLLTQVSGRAGRGNLPGRVLIQTYTPDHYSIQTAKNHDYLSFYNKEINLRQRLNYPPFTHIFSILITGENEKNVISSTYGLMEIMKFFNKKKKFELYGPAPAIISKIKNRYRWRILIKCKDRDLLMQYSFYCINKFNQINQTKGKLDINIQTDIDPLIMV
ncbi:primosomal protein N' [Defluviitalea phaphyphila]|uniref:primosomal protein N' n=1 Tax=Defluviitalea phaphyphila TaxID=1473580 RepID=UPI00072FFB95|nr:primosomal protein N' [Defluviitalea phaphyphila]